MTRNEPELIELLLHLAFTPDQAADFVSEAERLTAAERERWLALADSHHVILRTFKPLRDAIPGANGELAKWLENSLRLEQKRIAEALPYLSEICEELERAGCPTVCMKSLDHWPDLGNDLDLYTTGDRSLVHQVMKARFGAEPEAPSWGDRLSQKSNFAVPGLKELVEVHVQRLGQTGEHTSLARRIVGRRVRVELEGYGFWVPAPEQRIIIATLQRMYRHFYARACDLLNTAQLVGSGTIDFDELQGVSQEGGIWAGVATFLAIVSDYAARYRGAPLDLPRRVTIAARFGASQVTSKNRFLRIPIFPEGAELYTSQLAKTAWRGEASAALRLSLFPGLASVAAVAAKLTGSDKGIW
jgi:hypothetical protein